MAAPPAAPCDIDDYDELDYFVRSHKVSNILKQKGFCIIQSNLDRNVKLGAHREARKYRKDCALTRVPREACSSLFGESASCWTKELSHPESKEVPPEEECLRKVDKRLEEIGICFSSSSHLHCQLNLQGRWPGLLHHSKMPEDRPAPHLIELEEANDYIGKATVKKITLLHFLGPSPAKLTIRPRQDYEQVYEVTMKDDVIIVYRNDACVVSYSTRGFAASVQVDFIARMKQGLQEGPKDALPVPEDLGDWYEQRMQQVAEGGPETLDYMPMEFVREAKLTYFAKEPIVVKEMWFDLPSLPVQPEAGLTQIQAVILAGQDVVTEITSPATTPEVPQFPGAMPVLSGAKWDMSEYYDEDPENATDFKMYTKHLSVLAHDTSRDFTALREFGVTLMEDASLDHRARMIYEAHWSCVQKLQMSKTELNGKDMGFYAGVSGQNMSMCLNKAKINKHTLMGMSHSAMVSRLPYYFNSKGPAIAIDTEDSSSSVALDHAVQFLTQEGHGPYAFASAASFIEGPFETIMQCAAGVISISGRSRVFDESADGFVKGEGSVCAMLAPRNEEGETQAEQEGWIRPAIVGSAMNSKGQSSALAAPSGPSLADVVGRAARDASLPFNIVDAVEANASGNALADLIELGSIRQALRSSERTAHSVPVRATKSSYGNLGPVNGLVAVARTCALLERALHGPLLHLHQLTDTTALFSEEDELARMHFLTEVVEARCEAQLVGVSSFGTTGTNVHQILWGCHNSDHGEQRASAPISWWPAADVQEGKLPTLGYFIVGTMTCWETPLLMEDEGEGVYGYTLTMGDNNWECFQIWVDRDEDKVLHPNQVRAYKDSKIAGPESGVGHDQCWCITGITKTVHLINSVQAKSLAEHKRRATANGEEFPKIDTAEVYEGAYMPEGYTDANGAQDMPKLILNKEEAGKPGDKYRIRLHVRGKYKRLEWSKATGLDAISMPDENILVHQYMIIGDHSYWTFEPMTQEPSEPGLWVAEIMLLKDRSNFQIYRDSDWEQGFYPAKPAGDEDSKILGPDECGAGRNWQIQGKVGDVYRIKFRRSFDQEEKKSVHWEHLRSDEVDFEKLAESHEYFLVGTWSDFAAMQKMDYNEDTKSYSAQARIGRSTQESFQILLNSNWLSAVHPSFDDATIFGEDGHTLEGPDDDGADKYWTIGLRTEEAVSEGDLVTVHMDTSGGLPSRVWWESQTDGMSHQIKMALGCRRIFDRHCRLLGIPQDEDEAGLTPSHRALVLPPCEADAQRSG